MRRAARFGSACGGWVALILVGAAGCGDNQIRGPDASPEPDLSAPADLPAADQGRPIEDQALPGDDMAGCVDDTNCAAPNPRCDPMSKMCVPCLPDKDNCPMGQVCTQTNGMWGCSMGCKIDDDCKGQGPTFACCKGLCVNTAADNANCSACGMACEVGKSCCESKCLDTMVETLHCGACGKSCQPQNGIGACMAGACALAGCNMGFGDCDKDATNGCEADLAADAANCGGCGMACAPANATATCGQGKCGVGMCKMGFADCDKDGTNGCETDLNKDLKNCGGCGTACPDPQNGTGACVDGKCGLGACKMGFDDCDKSGDCETDLQGDTTNCGKCAMKCPAVPNGAPVCKMGACGTGPCQLPFVDCDPNTLGCETDTSGDVNNCGACATKCAAVANGKQDCQKGQCLIAACNGAFKDCNANYQDGCEVDTAGDSANCGACDNVCPQAPNSTVACGLGKCVISACKPGFSDCDKDLANGCEVELGKDLANCGACGTKCPAIANGTGACVAGNCVVATCATDFADCDKNPMNGCETPLKTSTANCGTCGTQCSAPAHATAQCANGACGVGKCDAGWGDCDGNGANGCETNLLNDVNNCNSCSTKCPAVPNGAPACATGMCGIGPCMDPFLHCNPQGQGCETNTSSDPNNCGGCGKACPVIANGTAGCAAKMCTVGSCNPGFRDCDMAINNGCETNIGADPANCGGCKLNCAPVKNGAPACANATCVTSCTAPFKDCDGQYGTGCEIDTGGDVNNCGACANKCAAVQNGTVACTTGKCVVGGCNTTFRDCDMQLGNGCEINTANDLNNCGACGNKCPALANAATTCSAGKCVIASCNAGFQSCDGNDANGCEINTTNNVQNCGGCNKPCQAVPNATLGCAASACVIASCAANFADCNKTVADGCEINLNTDTNNCKTCGNKCPAVPNGSPVCVNAVCGQGPCNAPFQDCNNMVAGCETDTSTSASHCGQCGFVCSAIANGTPSCTAGKCKAVCTGTFRDCDAQYVNGCEINSDNDVNHCGACANKCATVQNSTPLCSASKCALSCSAGYKDCNNSYGDGCEINIQTNPDNCGACGTRCSGNNITTRTCAGGACNGTCAANFGDCNNNKQSDGCEASLLTDVNNCGACAKRCPTGTVCTAGACTIPPTGTGSGGALTVNGTVTINAVATPLTGAVNATTGTLGSATGFAVGQIVLMHQTQGANAGTWQLNYITALNGNTATFLNPLRIAYSNSGANRAQVIVVPQYTTVTVNNGATLTAPAWNGSVGGILALQATGTVTVTGTINMTGRGYRGTAHGCTRRCLTGISGEGQNGPGAQTRAANGGGGGAGTGGQDCGNGGGGAYGANGANGGNATLSAACAVPGGVVPGFGGGAFGSSDLGSLILFGGAGGEGGADEDGAYPGGGGNGGGAIVLLTNAITVSGTIVSNGNPGGNGVNSGCGVGCGMGGGGAGAGGGIRLFANTSAALGVNRVTAGGNTGGTCTCSGRAGAGGNGRIAVKATTTSGTTTPTFVAQ